MSAPDARALALSRARALDLLAALFRDGPRAERLPALSAVDALRPHLPEPFDRQEAAAEHHRVLRREVFPHASVFLEPEGQLGGEVAREATLALGRLGYMPQGEPDHIAEQLAALRHLLAAEADALEDGEAAIALRVRELALAQLDPLLGWLPPFAAALRSVEAPLYAQAAALSLALCASWRAELGPPSEPTPLPPPPELLDDPKTGLARIARRLSTPCYAGVFLSAHRLRSLGRGLELPQGFGKRWQVLENLLHAAARYEAVPALVDSLQAALAEDIAWLEGLELPQCAPWVARIALTQGTLARIGQAAEEQATDRQGPAL